MIRRNEAPIRIYPNIRFVNQVMMVAKLMRKFRPVLLLILLIPGVGFGQCPDVFDFNGNIVDTPYWYSCSGGDFTFNLQSPDDWTDYEIDWGDGSAATTGTEWTSPAAITHTYTSAVDTFVVVITEIASGCITEGVVVMEEATSASIQIPVGGLTQACAPQELEFINSATNVSETTVFVWDFGDGSPTETYDYTNLGQTVSHTYEPNTVDCETEVSLTAENYCNTIQGGASEATFNPIRIWDVDEAAITASATVLCYPDTIVEFLNTTERNCLFQGNIYQRYEYWNFGDYWGEGQDSIIDWTPWPPTFPYEIGYPGIGTYEVMMLDSNFCGIDTANIVIEIVPPPVAGITASEDTVCVGEPFTFTQEATGAADSFEWNFGDGSGWLATGGGNITFIYNTPGTYTVCSAISIASSGGSCADTACVDVVVLPSPQAIIGFDNLTGCDELEVNFEDQSIDGMTSEWTFDVDPFTFSGGDPPPISYDAPGNYVVNLTVEGLNGCLDNTQELVTIFEAPEVDILANNVCQGVPASFTDFSTFDPGDPIISWNWDFGDGESSFDQNPDHTFDNTGTFTVTLTVNTANCSATESFPIDVEPAPIPDISVDVDNGCSPLEVNFSNNSTGASSYTWNFGDNQGSNDAEPSHTYYNFTPTDTTYVVTFTAFTAFGCGANDTLYVTVLPGAEASFLDNTVPPSCAPFEAYFENTSQGAVSYQWDLGDGTITTEESPSHLYENNTGFIQFFPVELIAYAPNGCNDTTYSNVTVYPTPDFSFDLLPDSGCAPLIVTMPFIQGINEYLWDFGDGSDQSIFPTPTHIFENSTLDVQYYTVELVGTSAFGCVDTAYSTVQVNPQPLAQFSVDINSGCAPLEVTFENLSLQADSYIWIYAPGDTAYTSDPFHTHILENTSDEILIQNVELIALDDDGCFDTYSLPIQLFPEAIASFDDPGNGCSPFEVDFFNTSQNGNTYVWDLGNGITSINENPSTIYFNNSLVDTTYNVTLEITSQHGCTDIFALDIPVNPTPVAEFDMSDSEGCHPAPVDITNLSTGAETYFWEYGDGDTSTNSDPVHNHTFTSTVSVPVEYQVTLVATNQYGCADTSLLPYFIYPPVTAEFVSNDEGCSPLEVDFNNLSLGGGAGYEWFFGDGFSSPEENPSHTYTNFSDSDVTFDATLVATSPYGCTDTIMHPITVFATPIADLEIASTDGCYPLEVTFLNNSIGGFTYDWVYGTGEVGNTTETEHTFTYYNFTEDPVTYDITLIAYSEGGCTSQDQLSIDVYPQLIADFDANDSGCSPLTVEFDNSSEGAISYEWYFGDGATSPLESPIHTYYNNTTDDIVFEAMLVVQSFYGCYDTLYKDINVFSTPEANFTPDPIIQTFPNTTVSVDNESIAGAATNYTWYWGDTNFDVMADPAPHVYETWGVYNIQMIASNGFCADTTWRSIEILPPAPIANFIGGDEGCAPLAVSFQNLSEYAGSYFWEFGDGGISTVAEPNYVYYQPGTYTVTLTVTGLVNGQVDIQVQESIVEVYAPAIAAFTYSPDEVVAPGQPVFTVNLSQNATDFQWNFGDGGSSTEFDPTYYYQAEGVYSIELIANNEWNCPDTFLIENAVDAIALGHIEFPNAFSPNQNESSEGFYDPYSYNNDIFFPVHYGITEYQLLIFNKWGELLFESKDVNQGWDGYYQGSICRQDVYAWKVSAKFIDGQQVSKAGDVTLLIK